MNSVLVVIWCLAGTVGLLCLWQLVTRLHHFFVTHFGVETTALVLNAHHYHKDGDVYLQGYYTYKDAYGREHTFNFTICNYWPGDERWRHLMHLYTEGAQNRVRYLRWLPTLHEIQTPV